MAKKQTPKKQPNKLSKVVSRFWQKNWFAVLLVVVLLGVLAFIGVNRLIIYNQKKQFDQAEKSLDTLYADIVKNVGQPTDVQKDKSCGYQSTVWGNGDRGCGILYTLSYDADADETTKISAKVSALLKSSPYITVSFEQNGNFIEGETTKPLDESAFTINIRNVVQKCSANIYYYDKADHTNYPEIKKSHAKINLSCSGNARSEFYPVKN